MVCFASPKTPLTSKLLPLLTIDGAQSHPWRCTMRDGLSRKSHWKQTESPHRQRPNQKSPPFCEITPRGRVSADVLGLRALIQIVFYSAMRTLSSLSSTFKVLFFKTSKTNELHLWCPSPFIPPLWWHLTPVIKQKSSSEVVTLGSTPIISVQSGRVGAGRVHACLSLTDNSGLQGILSQLRTAYWKCLVACLYINTVDDYWWCFVGPKGCPTSLREEDNLFRFWSLAPFVTTTPNFHTHLFISHIISALIFLSLYAVWAGVYLIVGFKAYTVACCS